MKFSKLLSAVGLTLGIPVVLAYLYLAIPFAPWLSAAVFNSGIALILVGCYRRSVKNQTWQQHELSLYLPSVAVLGICGLAVFVSSFYAIPERVSIVGYNYWWIIWIPAIEELVFRFGIGRNLRKLLGNLGGGYCSALCFSLTHTSPTVERLFAGEVGILLGPLLLGLVCEYLYVKGNNLLPCVVFHTVCNLTPVIFMYFDRRWLDWLHILFQTGI